MRLKRLRIENIATYNQQEINFDEIEYPIFVTGRTGAGKTTLFIDAITAALFGSAYGRKDREYGKILVMRGRKTGRIVLDFELAGKTYRVERIFREGGSSQAKLLELSGASSRLVSSSVKIVDSKIKEITGLTFDILINSAMIRQGDVYKFLRASPSERRNMLVEVLKINLDVLRDLVKEKKIVIENEIKKLSDEIRILNRDVSGKKSVIEEINKIRNEVLPTLNKELRDTEEKIKEIKLEIEERNKLLNNISESLGRLKAIEEQYDKALSSLNELEKRIERIDSIIKRYGEKILANLNTINDNLKNYKLLKLELEKLSNEINYVENKLREKKELIKLEKEKDSLEKAIKNLEVKEQELQEIEQSIRELNYKENELRKHLEELKSAEAFCPVCGAKLTSEIKQKRIVEMQRELEEIKNRINNETKLRENLEKEVNELNKLNNKLGEIRARINYIRNQLGPEDLEDKYRKLNENYNQLTEKLRHLQNSVNESMIMLNVGDIDQLEKKINELREIQKEYLKYEDLKERLDSIREELRKYSEELSKKKALEKKSQELESIIKLKKSQLKNFERRKDYLNKKISENEQRLKDNLEKLKEIENKERELKKLNKKKEKLELDFRAYLILESQVFATGALPTRLLDEYLRIIERYANDYLSRVFNQDIEIQFSFRKARGDQQSVELKSYSNGFERRIETFSGGEQTLIGFAIRLAIGKLLSQIYAHNKRPRFLIIDEGFGPLDEELRVTVAEALRDLKESNEFEQIIVISHQQELRHKPIFRTVIEIVKDARNISRVKEINPAY